MEYYDFDKALSYGCLINMIITNRGFGKTYGFKMWAIRDFLKTGAQFFSLRRYDEELKITKDLFFADVKKEFPDHDFKCDGYEYYIDGEPAGMCWSLSKASSLKSAPFPDINKLLYDEFLIDDSTHHYLKNEVFDLLNVMETIFRTRNNWRAFLMSNAVTITNPYFAYWDINLPYGSNFYRRDDLIMLNVMTNQDFIDEKNKTRFGRLVAGTKYGDYAINNKFLQDSTTFVEKKGKGARYSFGLKYKENVYGVWQDNSQGKLYLSNDRDPSSGVVFSLTIDDHSPNNLLIKGMKNNVLKSFFENFKAGNVRFENVNLKNVGIEMIKLTY